MTIIRFYDCTLRDGAQGPGITFSLTDKVRLARALDAFGFDYVEGGWPGANPKDTEFFRKLREKPLSHARLVAFGATRRAGLAAEADPQLQALLDSGAPAVAVFGKSWLLHVREVLQTTPEENLAMIEETVAFLAAQKREVFFEADTILLAAGMKVDQELANSFFNTAPRVFQTGDCIKPGKVVDATQIGHFRALDI